MFALTKAIFNDIVLESITKLSYEQYSYGQNGLVDSLRAILKTIHSKNKGYAQMLLRF